MRVSVIVPVYNGRTYIERCLGSMVPQLSEDMEVIVVDDASDDGTFELLEERYKDDKRIILVRSYVNRGVAASRNTGILLSRGDYISFCDSDDEWKEDKLKKQLKLLDENADLDMCFCDCENIRESDSDIARELMESAKEDRIHFRCGLMRREVFNRAGLLNEEMRIREDTEWLVRARKAGCTFEFIEGPLYVRHIYDEGLSASADPEEKKQRILDAFMKGLKNEQGERCVYDLSVLIPVYNAEKYLEEAVKSCHSDKHSFEIIMVNDGSKDGSLEVMKRMAEELKGRMPVTICHRAHKNQASSRNDAYNISRGKVLLYLDADDRFTDDAIDRLMEEAEKDPEAMVISALCQDFISPELNSEEASKLRIEPRPYRRMLAGCMLIRREVFDITGSYDEEMATSETAKWVMSIRDAGLKIKDADHIVLARRYHLNNLGRTNREAQMNSYMDMIRKRLKERSGKI